MQAERIPLTVGVTGHRAIRPADVPALRAGVKRELQRLQQQYPHSPLLMLNSLAEGADQLCAQVALELGIPLVAVLPLEPAKYEKDFEGEALTLFRSLRAQARQCFVAPAAETVPEAPSPSFFYRQAGIYVSTHCHVLLALWDGAPGKAGCGTAEAVDFALKRSYRAALGSPLFSATAVIHLLTPRGEQSAPAAGTVRILGDTDTWRTLMDRTEEFNALPSKPDPNANPLFPAGPGTDPLLEAMGQVYQRADGLSLQYAGMYRRILILLAVVSTLLTACFLLYD